MPSRIALVPVVLIPIVITSIISNSIQLTKNNIVDDWDDSPYYFPQGDEEINNHAYNFVPVPSNEAAADISKRKAISASHDAYDEDGEDCFRARPDTVHPSLYNNLPKRKCVGVFFLVSQITSMFKNLHCALLLLIHKYKRI